MPSPEPFITAPKLEAIGAIEASDLLSFMRVRTNISYDDRRDLFEKLYRNALERQVVTVQAKELPKDFSYAGRRVRFVTHFGHDVEGVLSGADEDESGDVCLKVDGKFRVVPGNIGIDVWPPEEPRICGALIGDHQAYGRLICDQPTGHDTAHQQSKLPEQCVKTRGGIQCALNLDHHFGVNATPHAYSNALNILRGQKRTRKERPAEVYSADFVHMNLDSCELRYREVEVPTSAGDGVHRGELTDAWRVSDVVIMVVDGRLYSARPHQIVKIFNTPKKPCPQVHSCGEHVNSCDLKVGHRGPHIYNNCC